jgi:hypothetical protein
MAVTVADASGMISQFSSRTSSNGEPVLCEAVANMTAVPYRPIPQQQFLCDAMQRLSMDREQFAHRLGITDARLQAWLAPVTDPGFLDLDPEVWRLVREIVADAPTVASAGVVSSRSA